MHSEIHVNSTSGVVQSVSLVSENDDNKHLLAAAVRTAVSVQQVQCAGSIKLDGTRHRNAFYALVSFIFFDSRDL